MNRIEELGNQENVATAEVTLESVPKYAVVVASKMKYEAKWIEKISPKVRVFLYHSDPSVNNDTYYVLNLGYEAAKYLKFIIDHYDSLEFESMIFLHGLFYS